MKSKILISFVIFLLIFVSSVYAYKISGAVKDSDTTNPLNGVGVRIEYTNGSLINSATTDSNGYYTIIINNATGVYVAKASINHYITQSKPFYNSADQTIDFALKSTTSSPACVDSDGDGYGASGSDLTNCPGSTTRYDCNSGDASIYPGAAEICDNQDNQCSGDVGYGTIDEGVKNNYYRDSDVDSYGNLSVTTQACSAPVGYVSNSLDCRDDLSSINPGVSDICGNGIDENCDGSDASCGGSSGGGGGGGGSGGASSGCGINLRELNGIKTITSRETCVISFTYEDTRYQSKIEKLYPTNLTMSLLGNQVMVLLHKESRLPLTSKKDFVVSYDKLDYGVVTMTVYIGDKQTIQPVTPIKPTTTQSVTETQPTTTTTSNGITGAAVAETGGFRKNLIGILIMLAIILIGSVVYYVFSKKQY